MRLSELPATISSAPSSRRRLDPPPSGADRRSREATASVRSAGAPAPLAPRTPVVRRPTAFCFPAPRSDRRWRQHARCHQARMSQKLYYIISFQYQLGPIILLSNREGIANHTAQNTKDMQCSIKIYFIYCTVTV